MFDVKMKRKSPVIMVLKKLALPGRKRLSIAVVNFSPSMGYIGSIFTMATQIDKFWIQDRVARRLYSYCDCRRPPLTG